MVTRREAIVGVLAGMGLGLRRSLAASPVAPASAWSPGLGARMRLLRGAPLGSAVWQAAIEIALDPGFKTYWRMPGDAGVPPAFDWSGSTNLAAVSAEWPVPKRFDEAGTSVVGYSGDGVVLPLRVSAKDGAASVDLKLSLAYAACKDICVPEKGEAVLTLDRHGPEGVYGALIEAAAREIPHRIEPAVLGLDQPGTVELSLAPHGPGLTLRPRLDGAERLVDVFIEGSDNWLFGAPRIGVGTGVTTWAGVALLDHPKGVDRSARIPFTLTLLTDMRSVETAVAVMPSD